MRVVLSGPTLTSALRDALCLKLEGAPAGSAQTPIAPLAAGLRKLGHHVTVISLDANIDEPVTLEEDGVVVTYCPVRAEPRYRARNRSLDLFEKEIVHLESAMRQAKPDIVHAHWTYEFAEAAVRTRLPHLVTMHDLGWDYFWLYRDAYRFMRVIMKYRTMVRVKHLTVVAPFMASKAKQYGYFGRVDVVPNGVVVPPYNAALVDARSMDAPVIASIGNSERIKNIQRSVEAFRLLRAERPQAQLHLFGPGLDEAYAAGEPGVFGHGPVDHQSLMAFLADKATLLMHPSLLETFGVIIAEAKGRGVPVVAGENSGGVAYACGDNGGAITVDVRSPEAIAEAMLSLIGDEQTYNHASRLAFDDAAERFSNEAIAANYSSLYARIVG